MSLFRMLKYNSRLALRGNWGRAVLVPVIFLAVSLVLSALHQYALFLFVQVPGSSGTAAETLRERLTGPEFIILSVFILLYIFLISPLALGAMKWFYDLVHSRAGSVSDLFCMFESARRYRRAIWLYIHLTVRTFLWALLYMAIPIVTSSLSWLIIQGVLSPVPGNIRVNATLGTMGAILSFALSLLAMVLYMIHMNRYALSAYLWFDDESLSVSKVIRMSVRYMAGYRGNLFLYQLTFIGWFLLCAFIFPWFYVYPYYATSITMYARYIIETNAMEAPEPTMEFSARAQASEESDYPTQTLPPHDGDISEPILLPEEITGPEDADSAGHSDFPQNTRLPDPPGNDSV